MDTVRETTLTVAVVAVDAVAGGYPFRVARVGDGQAFRLVCGEFLPLFGGPVERAAGVLAPGEALVLASDGVGVPVRETEAGTYLARSWVEPPGPVAFLHQLQFNLESFDDDRTSVVIWACGEH